MYQHPVPQNVTSYQFRLVGDMTLKQFFELAGGIGVGALFYFTNLPFIIKWPLILGSVVFGIGLAFVPLEERPLDKWIIACIHAIYRPTQFIWRKHPKEPNYLTHKPSQLNQQVNIEEKNQRLVTKQQGFNTFIKTLPHQETSQQVSNQETSHLDTISRLFYSSPNPIKTTTPPDTSPAIHPVTSRPIDIPTTTKIHLTPDSQAPKTDHSAPTERQPQPSANPLSTPQEQNFARTKANTTTSLPFPSTPTTPNTIVGMVLSADNHLIGNASIEIRLPSGDPVRATRTNKLGQFFSSIPLKNGLYDIYVEKDGYQFDIINLELTGNITPPLAINAKPLILNS